MRALEIHRLRSLAEEPAPLRAVERPIPEPGPGQVLLRLAACGVCHTELDEIEGRTAPPRLPVIPGHQAVGEIVAHGPGAGRLPRGARVGVAWIFSACGRCRFCVAGRENLCPDFQATGRDADGGYAQYMVAGEAFVHPLPAALAAADAAPLLCAGAIGYRSLALAGLADGQVLGLTGFGASGHLTLRLARHLYPASPVFVFARSPAERRLAGELGAAWTGEPGEAPPAPLDRAIDTTPAWGPVLAALEALAPGGRLVINAIRKEPADRDRLAGLDYARHLWLEREIRSVANVARRDVQELLAVAVAAGIRPEVQEYPLAEANRALVDLKERRIRGAKVLRID